MSEYEAIKYVSSLMETVAKSKQYNTDEPVEFTEEDVLDICINLLEQANVIRR